MDRLKTKRIIERNLYQIKYQIENIMKSEENINDSLDNISKLDSSDISDILSEINKNGSLVKFNKSYIKTLSENLIDDLKMLNNLIENK